MISLTPDSYSFESAVQRIMEAVFLEDPPEEIYLRKLDGTWVKITIEKHEQTP